MRNARTTAALLGSLLALTSASLASAASYTFVGGGTNVAWNTTSTTVWSGGVKPISDAATSITLNGKTTSITSGNNNIADPLTLNALNINNNSTLTQSVGGGKFNFVTNGATLPTIAQVTNNKSFTINNGLNFTNNTTYNGLGNTVTFAGALGGSGSLTINSAYSGSSGTVSPLATLALTADNTSYTGAMLLNGAKLSVGANGATGSGTLTVQNNVVSGGPTVRAILRSTTATGTTTYQVKNNVNLQTDVQIGDTTSTDDLAFTGNWTLGASAILTVQNQFNGSTISGNIGDGGNGYGIVKRGNANLTLSGNNTFSGGVQILSSTLTVTSDAALGAASGGVRLNSGTLGVSGDVTTSRTVTLSGANSSTAPTGTLTVAAGKTLTLNGLLTPAATALVNGPGTLTKNGAGTLVLNNTGNNFTGATNVTAGDLTVNGVLSSAITLSANTSLGGSGTVGSIAGAGIVGPGNSPGILTAGSVNPSGGTTFKFELGSTGSPNYLSATNSLNDVLHLTGATPFSSNLTTLNEVDVFFTGNVVAGTYRGGFAADQLTASQLLSAVSGANWVYYVEDALGTTSYNGKTYSQVPTGNLIGVQLATVSELANFGSGSAPLAITQFQVVAAPEPATLSLLGLGAGALLARRRRKA